MIGVPQRVRHENQSRLVSFVAGLTESSGRRLSGNPPATLLLILKWLESWRAEENEGIYSSPFSPSSLYSPAKIILMEVKYS